MRTTRTIRLSGCKKIPKSLINIDMEYKNDEPRVFSADINLDSMNLPPSSQVYVDTHVLNSYQRFHFGSVAKIEAPASTELTDLDEGGTVQFRVKVVDESGKKGRLIASAHGLKAKDEGDNLGREPLLRLLRLNLEDVPWRIEFLEDAMPGLILNSKIPGVIQLAEHDPVFQALLLPAAVREIYHKIYAELENSPDADTWQGKWLTFGSMMTGRDAPDVDDEGVIDTWVEGVVEKFAAQHQLVERLLHKLEVE